MATISVTLPNDGETIDASDIANPVNTIVTLVNGNLDNDNIKTAAGIDGSKLADNSVSASKLAAGAVYLGSAEVTSNQGSITSSDTDITSLTTTVTVPSGGRHVEVSVFLHAYSTVGGDTYRVFLKQDGTQVQSYESRFFGNNEQTAICFAWVGSPSAGSHTYKVSMQRATGTGTLSTFQAATRPAQIIVKAI